MRERERVKKEEEQAVEDREQVDQAPDRWEQ